MAILAATSQGESRHEHAPYRALAFGRDSPAAVGKSASIGRLRRHFCYGCDHNPSCARPDVHPLYNGDQAVQLLLRCVWPYPILDAAFAAGISQAHNKPLEWKRGAAGYSKRFGSDLAIAAVTTTTRYGLAKAYREDTLYYRCECKGVFPRLRHAVISTLSARRGEDRHRVFSFPALIAPYAGSMTAICAWYPRRYNGKVAFRMGNYTILGYVGGNIALEFVYRGPHSLLHRMHLNNGHGAPNPSSNQ